MAASDARRTPVKGVAYRVTFPIFNVTGDLVAGAAGLDSEVSIDGGTFTDCTNEATQIATSSGMYYLDLTAAEMAGDTIAVIVKTSTTDAKTTPLVFYPERGLEIRGTADTGCSTTSIVTSSLVPAASVTDQFKGRVVIFSENTTTAALRGQATDITASSSGGVLTVTALTTAPASGDTFVIV